MSKNTKNNIKKKESKPFNIYSYILLDGVVDAKGIQLA